MLKPLAALLCLLPALLAQQAPSDPEYKKLRDLLPAESFTIENLTIRRDTGEFTFKSGTISFTAPVMGRVTSAVFVGQGEFKLTPAVASETKYLSTLYGMNAVREEFSRAVFFFTDDSYKEMKGNAVQPVSPATMETWVDVRDRLRHRSASPQSFVEAIVTGEDMDNVDADLLADLYHSGRGGAFNAYMRGNKYPDLRYFVRPRGAMPSVGSPEEVALVNVNPGNEMEGIWYLAHLRGEYANGQAKSSENKWSVDVEQYRITTEIGKNEHLNATAELTFKTVAAGERVLKFGLLPNLRVTGARMGQTQVPFIQEGRNQDGSLYVVLPEPVGAGQSYQLTIAYAGDKVITDAGGGNFYVEARTSWYPVLNTFTDQAKYDLTFRSPKQYTLVSVGKPLPQKREGDFSVSQWVSEVPLAVAGFNYGQYKMKEAPIKELSYGLESYANSEVPDYLKQADSALGLSPTSMANTALQEANFAVRIFSEWFGKPPYGRIAIRQQPDLNFGQSWPTLVYLPMLSYLDSTQRYRIFGGINSGANDFVAEVNPHEVAHQWWGHMVGWSSYRDQWLSEGFADFSAGVFLQLTQQKPDKYYDFLDKHRDKILAKNSFGFSPNDAGALNMGSRLNTPRSSSAYNNLVYPKGSYILHMLRMMFWEAQGGDQRFKAMMKDYVSTYLYKTASTEDFQAIVEKHMKPEMNLAGNGKMDWFFDEWVRGTNVPRYKFEYQLAPADGGKTRLTASLTQSGVSDDFMMPVPIYMDLDGKTVRLGTVPVKGNTTNSKIDLLLPVKPRKLMINSNYDILAYE